MSKAVSKHLLVDYEEFRNHPDPFDLGDVAAGLRTLMVEIRETIDGRGADMLLQFGQLTQAMVESRMVEELDWTEEDAKELGELVSNLSVRAHAEIYGIPARITTKEAVDIAKVGESLSKVLERYKKMAEGIPLKIVYDNRVVESLTRFTVQVIMKYVPEAQQRAIAEAAMAFLPNYYTSKPAIPMDVVEV